MADAGCSCCATPACLKADLPLAADVLSVGTILSPDLAATAAALPSFARGPDYADTVSGSISSGATLAIGSSIAVTIETPSDHDWYGVVLTAGMTYTIHTTAMSGGGNPDSFIALRDSAGTLIVDDDDGGDATYSVISYTAATTGTYFIDAGTYSGQGQSSAGSYHLSIAAVLPPGADSVAASSATTGALAVGGSVNGNIDTNGDRDWYAITLTAGESYLFRTGTIVPLTGSNPSNAVDTLLRLRDGAGVELASNDDAGEFSYSVIRFTAPTTATYYLDVGGFRSATGAFNLTAFATPALAVFSNDQISSQLTNGYWGGDSHRFNVAPGGALSFNVQSLTAAGQTLAREALLVWSDVLGIGFTEVTSGGQIVFDDNQSGAFANASYAGGFTTGATVNVSTQWLSNYGTGLNSYSFQTYLHEIGHALGLGHAGNYNGDASYALDALYQNDAWSTTIMSYFNQTENSYFQAQGFTRQFMVTPMAADGVATGNLYGTHALTRPGNTTYGFNNTSGRAVYDAAANPNVTYTIFDSGGVDTLDYSGFSQAQTINLNAETFSNTGGGFGNMSIARGTVIENAIGGAGNDTLIGNAADNRLAGGPGNDVMLVDGFNDVVVENIGAGSDRVLTTVSYILATGAEIEFLSAQNAVGTDPIFLTGNGFDQTITGNNGNNIINGLGGSDTMVGLGGNDTFLVRGLGDVVIEAVGGGSDLVYTTVDYNLGENEVEALSTVTQADTVPINLIGNYVGQTIVGNYGDNLLNGGSGLDTLIGLFGNDLYAVGDGRIVIVEAEGQGADTVVTSVDYVLGADVSVEVLSAQIRSSTMGLTLTGNRFGQTITGTEGADRIDGGAGNDLLIGGGGADRFDFTTLLGPNNVDAITDFSPGDRIGLGRQIFAVGTGLDSGEFVPGTAAADADDRIIYNQATGQIFYDADGNGAGLATLFAVVAPGTTLSAADFEVIAP